MRHHCVEIPQRPSNTKTSQYERNAGLFISYQHTFTLFHRELIITLFDSLFLTYHSLKFYIRIYVTLVKYSISLKIKPVVGAPCYVSVRYQFNQRDISEMHTEIHRSVFSFLMQL